MLSFHHGTSEHVDFAGLGRPDDNFHAISGRTEEEIAERDRSSDEWQSESRDVLVRFEYRGSYPSNTALRRVIIAGRARGLGFWHR